MMKTRIVLIVLCVIALLFLTTRSSADPGATPLGAAFTYQGRLDRDGQPFTGTCDFQFGLWDAASGGSQIGLTSINLR